MTLRISLSPAEEATLRERAAVTGEPIEAVATQIVKDALHKGNGAAPGAERLLSPDEAHRQLEALRAWGRLARPTGRPLDDSRESIYEGRGE